MIRRMRGTSAPDSVNTTRSRDSYQNIRQPLVRDTHWISSTCLKPDEATTLYPLEMLLYSLNDHFWTAQNNHTCPDANDLRGSIFMVLGPSLSNDSERSSNTNSTVF